MHFKATLLLILSRQIGGFRKLSHQNSIRILVTGCKIKKQCIYGEELLMFNSKTGGPHLVGWSIF
jgi:hypothetical protein